METNPQKPGSSFHPRADVIKLDGSKRPNRPVPLSSGLIRRPPDRLEIRRFGLGAVRTCQGLSVSLRFGLSNRSRRACTTNGQDPNDRKQKNHDYSEIHDKSSPLEESICIVHQ